MLAQVIAAARAGVKLPEADLQPLLILAGDAIEGLQTQSRLLKLLVGMCEARIAELETQLAIRRMMQ